MKIIQTGSYVPTIKIENREIEANLHLEEGYINKRTGIEQRFYLGKDENVATLAIEAVRDLTLKNTDILNKINFIIVATTTPEQFMPGIANQIQLYFNIKNAICLDILAGCSGFINAIDIAHLYLEQAKKQNISNNIKILDFKQKKETSTVYRALVVGVDALSKYTNQEDVGTSILLSDGAGAILLESEFEDTNIEKKVKLEQKKYVSYIESTADEKQILTCCVNEQIKMQGKEIYKYAVTKPVENVRKLLDISGETWENVKYIVPHQSNLKIMKAIENRLKIPEEKMYKNISKVGNTFCASIPIALDEICKKHLIKEGEKIVLLGYGGGLNTGSVLMEY